MRQMILVMLIIVLAGCGGQSTAPTEAITAPVETAAAEEQGIFYYAFAQGEVPQRIGTVVIIPDQITLVPTSIPVAKTDDAALNIETALRAMIADQSNLWGSTDLAITGVTFEEGLATVRLSGTITAPGGAILSAAGTQILLTVFSDTAVESAVITLNDESIRNLGISNSTEALPPEHVYIRADVSRIIEGG